VGGGQAGAQQACGVEAWWSGNLAGLPCGGLVEWLSGKPVELGPGRPKGWRPAEQRSSSLADWRLGLWGSGLAEWRSSRPMWSWVLAGPKWRGAQWSGTAAPWACGAGTWQAGCSFSKSWHGEIFHKLGVQSAKFWLPLVLYLSQVCFQHLSKVPESWSSCSLQLCPSHPLGPFPRFLEYFFSHL
jgi:hypothetical protein